MCFVSLVATSFTDQPGVGSIKNWPDQPVLDLAEVIQKLDKIDKALQLRDCKDAEKEKFLTALIDRVNEIAQKRTASKPKRKRKK